jgi:hypothetical protein
MPVSRRVSPKKSPSKTPLKQASPVKSPAKKTTTAKKAPVEQSDSDIKVDSSISEAPKQESEDLSKDNNTVQEI